VLVGPALGDWMGRRRPMARALLCLALFLPVNGLALSSRALDPQAGVRQPWQLPAYRWMRARLPANAVLLTPNGEWDSGNFTGRDQYFAIDRLAVQLGYPAAEISARRALVDRLFLEGRLEPADRERLARLGRPVYAVWTDLSDSMWTRTPGAFSRAPLPVSHRPPWGDTLPVVYESDTHVVAEVIAEPGARTAGDGRDVRTHEP